MRMGFRHFLSILEFPILPMYLESVIERYNPRTCSIVTRVGKFVLSLEDMVRPIGLQVTGCPMTGLVCFDYTAMMGELVGGRVVMFGPRLFVVSSTIHQVKDSCYTAMEPGVDADQQLRTFLLVLFGVVLFCHSTSRVSAVFLPLLANLDIVGEYAWGAASLALLYSVLFRFSNGNSRQLVGNLTFLQVIYHYFSFG